MRIRSHELEDESKIAFRQIIPSEWVIRDQNPDYGLDVQVQIFKNQQPIPFFFFVQLKGSDNIPLEQKSPSYSFSTKRLFQYIECLFPVMLVLFDSKGKRLFYEWTHILFGCISPEMRRKWHFQKTVAVRFTHRLDTLDSSIIEREVRHQFFKLGYYHQKIPEKFIIEFSMNLTQDLASQLQEKIIRWLASSSISSFVRIEKNRAPDGVIEINSKPPSLVISWGEKTATINLKSGPDGKISIDNLLVTLKVVIAMILSRSGLTNIALDFLKRIIFEESPLSSEVEFLFSLPPLAKLYAETNRVAEAIDIAEQLLKRGYFNCALNIASSVLNSTSNPQFYFQKYRSFLKAAIETTEENTTKASLHYNLANSLRHDSYFRQAIHQYHKAALEDPTYRERSYWWAELGGCFFLLKKLTWSEKCYRKAIELEEKVIPVQALLGDVLLYKGKFNKAKIELEKYLKKTKPPLAEFVLKRWLACLLFRKFGDTCRNPSSAEQFIEQAIAAKNREDTHQKLIEALKTDPLCGLAWFNYAVYQSQEKRNDRYWEWLATGIIQNWDIEAWANTILLMVTEEIRPPMNLAAAATYEAFRLYGASLEVEMKKRLDFPVHTKGKDIKVFISMIVDMARNLEDTFAKEEVVIHRFISRK